MVGVYRCLAGDRDRDRRVHLNVARGHCRCRNVRRLVNDRHVLGRSLADGSRGRGTLTARWRLERGLQTSVHGISVGASKRRRQERGESAARVASDHSSLHSQTQSRSAHSRGDKPKTQRKANDIHSTPQHRTTQCMCTQQCGQHPWDKNGIPAEQLMKQLYEKSHNRKCNHTLRTAQAHKNAPAKPLTTNLLRKLERQTRQHF